MMSYEKVKVYQRSIQFLTLALQISQKIPPAYSELADQRKRAAIAAPLKAKTLYSWWEVPPFDRSCAEAKVPSQRTPPSISTSPPRPICRRRHISRCCIQA